MTKRHARRLPAAIQEAIRRKAVRLEEEGVPQTQIARELGVSRSAVAGWISRWRRCGETALASQRHGRPKGTGVLSADQKAWLFNALCNTTPEQCGCNARLWSSAVIRTLLQSQFGFSPTKALVSLWIRQLGFVSPIPLSGGIREYDDSASESAVWRFGDYLRIKRLARRQKAKILLFDERPMHEHPFHILSAVDGRGTLRFMVIHPPVTADKRIDFMERLIVEYGRPVFLLLDSHPNHDNALIRRWQRQNAHRLTLWHIPIRDLALLPAQCWPSKKAR